jgi:EAL domain-containing protein (putative c-di-GMP-specific phosphodiesterase class I)
VTAEGVESHEIWTRLRDLGCDSAQGYYLSRATPAGEMSSWIERRKAGAPVAA